MSKTTQQDRLMSITTPLGEDFVLINRLKATEGISSLYSFEVELLHAEEQDGNEPTAVDPKSILGQAVSIKISQADGPDSKKGTTRHLNGIVNHFSQGHRDVRFSYYYATIVPQVWLLTQISRSRIFQHKNVPDILREVFEGLNVSFELQGDFKPRNYCVQYRETDFDFASRLMEEEGIYYFFEHKGGKHKMIVANTPQSHLECPSKSNIPYFLKVTQESGFISSIRKWQNDYRLQSGKVTFWDYHFQTPTNKLDAVQPSLFKVANNDRMEIYDFPGGYARKYDDIDRGGGERSDVQNVFEDKQKKAEIAMQSLDSQYRVITGISDCSALTTGHRFTLFNHPSVAQNGDYIVTSATHEAEQHPTYVSDDEVRHPYTNSFSCIAYGKDSPPFRPVRRIPKPTVRGSQTAVVVGPAGEEIFTDKYGRVKVQFHWDRQGKVDSDSSCWVRVSQAWAGNRWGMMFIPRIGMEVIVHFLEGDPDQPIITGCVYNPETMPPYPLPAEKTKMTIKSNSSLGGGGFNEIRFEDKKGKEQIFIHAEKDEDIRVENNTTETIVSNRHLSVGNDQYEKVGKDKHLEVGGDKNEKIGGSLSLNVGADIQEKAEKKYAIDAGKEIHLKSGKIVVIEADLELMLKCGSGFITIKKDGTIYIKGRKVLINSGGGVGSGSGCSPDMPTAPKTVDKTGAGQATGKKPAPPPLTPKQILAWAIAMQMTVTALAQMQKNMSEAAKKKAAVDRNKRRIVKALLAGAKIAAPYIKLFDSNTAKNKPTKSSDQAKGYKYGYIEGMNEDKPKKKDYVPPAVKNQGKSKEYNESFDKGYNDGKKGNVPEYFPEK